MNLFILDIDAKICARLLDDKRMGSALMEATMMLSVPAEGHGETGPGLLCRPSHRNHPVTLWVGATRGNWRWTLAYAHFLNREYCFRFGKQHGAGRRLGYIGQFGDCLPAGPLLPFQNQAKHTGLGLDFTHLPVPISYRKYLLERWKTDKRSPTYRKQGFPEWAGSIS